MTKPHFYDELSPDPYALLNCSDVAAIIGVHPVSVRRLRMQGRLPEPDYARGPGNVVLWFVRTIRPWIEARQKALSARKAAA